MFLLKRRPILDEDEQQRIVAAIKEVEPNTTGEIRVFIEHKCSYMDAIDRAAELFARLKMYKTENRNAILVYMALKDRQYAIVGDIEIHNKAGGQPFWENAADLLKGHFKNNQVTEGMVNCIHELGKALAVHFPADPSVKKNELPDEIVFGK